MNLILLVLLVGVILLVLGNPSKTKRESQIPKEKPKGYSTLTDYNFDAASVYGAFQK